MNRISPNIILLLTCFTIFISCNSTSNDGDDQTKYYEFTHADSKINYSIIAKTSDPEIIEKVEDELARPFNERNLHINGDIEQGNGGYNNNWSWHFVPDQWDLVEMSTEVCDGRPQFVEEELDYWLENVGYYCPWNSRVVGEVQR